MGDEEGRGIVLEVLCAKKVEKGGGGEIEAPFC